MTPVYVNRFFEEKLEQIFDLAELVERIFSTAELEYRIVGGVAVYLYVEEAGADAGRLTQDLDITVRRQDLERIAQAAEPFGLHLRHVGGVDMLVQADNPSARKAVHLVFAGERVAPQYSLPAPELGPGKRLKGLRLMPLEDLIRMKLTSFRSKDETHIDDLDEVGLITPEIEARLPLVLRQRLDQARLRRLNG